MKRDKLKILGCILELCEGNGTNKTKIVYGVNMSFPVADRYIDLLIKENLVEVIAPGPREKYIATVKGKEMIRTINEIYVCIDKYPL